MSEPLHLDAQAIWNDWAVNHHDTERVAKAHGVTTETVESVVRFGLRHLEIGAARERRYLGFCPDCDGYIDPPIDWACDCEEASEED